MPAHPVPRIADCFADLADLVDPRVDRTQRRQLLDIVSITLRKLALQLIRQNTTRKRGVKTMRMKSAWDTTYLLPLLGAD